jgi:hypothetical protein
MAETPNNPGASEIPDAIPADIGDLFRSKANRSPVFPGLPRLRFSHEHRHELAVLMGALIAGCDPEEDDSSPSPQHYVTLACTVVGAMKDMHIRMMEEAADTRQSREAVAALAQLYSAACMAEFALRSMSNYYANVIPDPSRSAGEVLSPQMLEALGTDPESFSRWFRSAGSSRPHH